MNVELVARATWAVAEWLRANGSGRTVVVGCDARHGSADFFTTTTGVLAAAGFDVIALPGHSPTPLVAFTCRDLGAAAAIQITASHNPAGDNGYKLYGGIGTDVPGAQIVSPIDARIEALMAAAPPEIPCYPVAPDDHEWAAASRYLDRLATRFGHVDDPLRIALTPMHGVGGRLAVEALANAGFDDVHVVDEQADPDPDFPTVAFPNPEEPGALDLAIATAVRVGADLIVALDPDADRCSVAIPEAGGWRQLSGDELGALLGEQAAVAHAGDAGATLARSLVSSSLLGQIATAHGLAGAETLTGFKWISRAPGLVFGYEEAIGYCVNPTVVRDKDGISAAVKACELAARLKAEGRTLADQLADLAVRHGLHATSPLTFRVEDLSVIGRALQRLRDQPPTSLAGAPVVAYDDLTEGYQGLPPTDGVRIATDAGDRVIVRPSGTEPKLKCYLEVVAPVGSVEDLPQVREAAAARLDRIKDELRQVLGL
jgi:phosphomannomutase